MTDKPYGPAQEEKARELVALMPAGPYRLTMVPLIAAALSDAFELGVRAAGGLVVPDGRLVDPVRVVCGACGDPWSEGMSCAQKDNGHSFPTCYAVAVGR